MAEFQWVQGLETTINLRNRYHFIYRKPVLSQEELRSSDSDKVSQKVEEATREFYDKDYWPIVNAVREEFDLPAVSPN